MRSWCGAVPPRWLILPILLCSAAACSDAPTRLSSGPAASLTKLAGDSIDGSPGEPVQTLPIVQVADAHGRAVPGITVTFSVVSGGGAITGAVQTTDADGEASLGDWMLGPYVGMNRVRAWVDGVTPVTFTVSAIGPCQRYIAHAYGGTSSGALTGSDCTFANGAFVDRYTLAVPSGVAAIRLDQRSTDFDAFLILYDSAGHPLGFDDDISTSSLDASLKILLPAGRYRLDATSAFGGETGSYSLTSGATPPEVDGCEGAFITRGVTTSQVVHETDCAIPAQAAGYYFSDQYGFFLATGQTATIRMHSSALDPYLVIYDLSTPEPTIEAEDDDGGGGTDAFVTIIAQRPSFFVVDASTALTNRVGAYTLTIR